MSFWKKRFPENDYEQEQDYNDGQDSSEVDEYSEPEFIDGKTNVFSMNSEKKIMEQNNQMNMVIFRPTEYEQAQTIIDFLKLRKPIIVNLDEIEVAVAQRILDFITGAVYALAGDIKKAAKNIFVVVPSNVGISDANTESSGSEFVQDEFNNAEEF